MAIDNSLHDSLQKTYFKIQDYLESVKLQAEHSAMIIKHEELAELLERLDIEAIEEQSEDIHALHAELDSMKIISEEIITMLENTKESKIVENVVSGLERIFLKINAMIV